MTTPFRLVLSVVLSVAFVACSVETPTPTATPTPTLEPGVTPTVTPTVTPEPTLTPAITTTPLPTPEQTEVAAAPTSVPTEERTYNECVGIASDSNGFGHVTFQRPDTDQIAITYITPLAVPLRVHLEQVGLGYLEVIDESLSAAGLTVETSNYLLSSPYFRLKQTDCLFYIITPFYPDVAVGLSEPASYIENLDLMIHELQRNAPDATLILLYYYLTDRAEFTVSNSGFGLTPERIAAFNAAIAQACTNGYSLADWQAVVCVDPQPFFTDMESPYVLGRTDQQDFEASLYRTTTFTDILFDYFDQNPEGALIGDGIHLSLAGRDRLTEALADLILELMEAGR
ncbi:MAG: hypothetical protein GYB64_19300 [Chloroflexi bacterium]|nr:hypothetical protein [Chloroflexota bacterium]